jgi:hypothetical protein
LVINICKKGKVKDAQKELAVENYEKSLDLNPNNTNTKKVLSDLNMQE